MTETKVETMTNMKAKVEDMCNETKTNIKQEQSWDTEFVNMHDYIDVGETKLERVDPITTESTSAGIIVKIETTNDECTHLADDEISENDMDQDDEDFPLLTVAKRDATLEPAAETDLTVFETRVLATEDRANDRALKDLVPKDCYEFNWTKDRQSFLGRRETFTGTPGPTFKVTGQTRVVDVFYKMIDTDFVEKLCMETNRYASQKIALLKAKDKLLPSSRLTRWTQTNKDEMIIFLAVTILQGLYPLPEEEAYFSFNGYGTMPYFCKIMSYNRFLLLKSMLHFVDNDTITEPNKLSKIQPVIDYFNDKFSCMYYPSQEIVIDESLLKWHGKLSFAQKIKTKTAQVGVKTYELCESSSGYLWKFFVYAGKNKQTATVNDATDDKRINANDNDVFNSDNDDKTNVSPEEKTTEPLKTESNNARPKVFVYAGKNKQTATVNDATNDKRIFANDNDVFNSDNDDETNVSLEEKTTEPIKTESNNAHPRQATFKIVFDLVEPLLYRGHTLIMDNFYNSPLLLRWLKRQKTDCYGTLRLNREFVPSSLKTLTKTDLQRGEVMTRYCSDLSMIVWRDANIVSLISTYHHLQMEKKQKDNILVQKPNIVLDYNKSMGGVDRKEQFLSAQPIERVRNKIWYKKLFRRLFNAALFNCFVIFSTVNPKMTNRLFRTVLAEDLLKIHKGTDLTKLPRLAMTQTGPRQRPMKSESKRPKLKHRHFPIRNGASYSRCWMCSQRRKSDGSKVCSRTVWKCMECNVNLCIDGCFMEYHI